MKEHIGRERQREIAFAVFYSVAEKERERGGKREREIAFAVFVLLQR